MKKLFAYVVIFFSIVVLLNLNNISFADPARYAGQACTLSGGVAGAYQQSASGAIECVENNPAAGQEPRRQTMGDNPTAQGTCADMLATTVTESDGTAQPKRPTVSSDGFMRWLCTQPNSNPNRNAIEIIIEVFANYILVVGAFILTSMMALAFVQITTAGNSPEALKSGKKRLMLAVSSIVLITIGRVVLDLIGVTGGNFIGVPLATFNKDTIPLIIQAAYHYIMFIGGSLGVGMIIFGGIKMMTSAGSPQAIQGARRVITYAVIGLLGLASIGIIVALVQKVVAG